MPKTIAFRPNQRRIRAVKSLYEKTIAFVLQYIDEQKLREGDQLPTEAQLSALAGVSLVTVRRALSEPAFLIAANAGLPAAQILARTRELAEDEGFDALHERYGNMVEMGIIDPLRVCRSALQNGASVAGLLLTTNSLIAEEQNPWGGSAALMTEFGPLDGGLHQPSPDSSTPQSLGMGPSVA